MVFNLFPQLGPSANTGGTWALDLTNSDCINTCPSPVVAIGDPSHLATVDITQMYIDNLPVTCNCVYKYTVNNGVGCTDTATVTFTLIVPECSDTALTIENYIPGVTLFTAGKLLIDGIEPDNYAYALLPNANGVKCYSPGDPQYNGNISSAPIIVYKGNCAGIPVVPTGYTGILHDVSVAPDTTTTPHSDQYYIGAGYYSAALLCIDGEPACQKICCDILVTISTFTPCASASTITMDKSGADVQYLDFTVPCGSVGNDCVKFIMDGSTSVADDFTFFVYNNNTLTWDIISEIEINKTNLVGHLQQSVINIENNTTSTTFAHLPPTIQDIECKDQFGVAGNKSIRLKVNSHNPLAPSTIWSVSSKCCDCLQTCPPEDYAYIDTVTAVPAYSCSCNSLYTFTMVPAYSLSEINGYIDCLNLVDAPNIIANEQTTSSIPNYAYPNVIYSSLPLTPCSSIRYGFIDAGTSDGIILKAVPTSPGFVDYSIEFTNVNLYNDAVTTFNTASTLTGGSYTNMVFSMNDTFEDCIDGSPQLSGSNFILEGVTVSFNPTSRTITFENLAVTGCHTMSNGFSQCNYIPIQNGTTPLQKSIYYSTMLFRILVRGVVLESNLESGNTGANIYCTALYQNYKLILLDSNDLDTWIFIGGTSAPADVQGKIIQKGIHVTNAMIPAGLTEAPGTVGIGLGLINKYQP